MSDYSKVEATLKEGVKNNKAYTLKPIETPIKLNQNESPFDIPDTIKDKILSKLKEARWNIYPDFVPDELYQKIASFYGFNKENILIGNGSNEMIFTILTATLEKGKKVIIPQPTFTVYGLISSNLNATIKTVPLNADFSFNVEKLAEESKAAGSVTILCTPNNPTGTYLKRAEIEKILKASGGTVVVDEAYIHFGGESVIDLVNKYSNLIVLRTFSKAFGLAGLRVGFMVSNKNLITELAKVKLPYNLNVLTLITLNVMFDNIEFVENNIKQIKIERDFVKKELEKIKQIRIIPSAANFFLIEIEDPKFLFNKLVEGGILIRDYSDSPLLQKNLRISVGNREENESLIKLLNKIYSK
jgi:histidinol-phosphate aminotransferase